MKPASEPEYMPHLRALVEGDGLDLQFVRVDPMTGTLFLDLLSADKPCPSCHMSSELLSELALPVVKRLSTNVLKVSIIDKRTKQG